MADGSARGPKVPSDENVFRLLTNSLWVKDGRPSTAAFSFPKFSVDRSARTSPEVSAARFVREPVTHVAEFNVGFADSIGMSTHEEIDEDYPDNDAHAHVYHSAGSSGRKKAAIKLALACTLIEVKKD